MIIVYMSVISHDKVYGKESIKRVSSMF